MNPPHAANPAEPLAPPTVDISSEAVAEFAASVRVAFRHNAHRREVADLLEALSADRDRLAKTDGLAQLVIQEGAEKDATIAHMQDVGWRQWQNLREAVSRTEKAEADRTEKDATIAYFQQRLDALIGDRDRLAKAWAEASASLETTSGYLASARALIAAEEARERDDPLSQLDAIVHALEIEDSFTTPLDPATEVPGIVRAAHAKLAEGA